MILDYSLLDSGGLKKLERLGSKTLIRPSTISLWSAKAPQRWKIHNAEYIPESGWRFIGKPFEEWEVDFGGLKLTLRLQDNGQIGVFPEHSSYLLNIKSVLNEFSAIRRPTVLNLFGYTGAASLWCRSLGASVCHVDLSKKALSWTQKNFEINSLWGEGIKLICEDAKAFVDREGRREKRYDLILVDPPSFSRVSSSKSWKIEDVLVELLQSCISLLGENGTIFFTTHAQFPKEVFHNLLLEALPKGATVESDSLLLEEEGTGRKLPCGYIVKGRMGS